MHKKRQINNISLLLYFLGTLELRRVKNFSLGYGYFQEPDSFFETNEKISPDAIQSMNLSNQS